MIKDQIVLDRIEDLRHYTKTNIDNVQHDCTPGIMNIHLENMFFFIYRGVRHPIRFHRIQIYMSRDIPFIYTHSRYEYFKDFLYNAVLEQKIFSFLLFVGGKVINWSHILIIKDYNYCYLMILDYPDIIREAEIVYFPTEVRYGENDDIDTSLKGLYFDEDGLLTDNPANIATRLELLNDEKIGMYIFTPTVDNPQFEIPVKKGQITNINTIVPFKDGILYPEGLDYLTHEGYNIYSMSGDEIGQIIYYVFYFNPSNINKSYLYKADREDNIKQTIKDFINGTSGMSSDINKIRKNIFDFTFTRQKSYEQNTTDAMNYIKSYDQSLMNPVYKELSTVYSETYSGQYILDKSDNQGYFSMSRCRHGHIDDYIMVFVNGKLYPYHKDIKYEASTVKIPTHNICNDDDIEIIYFTDVNNFVTDIKVTAPNTANYVCYEYNVNNIMLFSAEASKLEFRILEQDDNTQFEVPFAVRNVGDHLYSFTFEDPIYYNKNLWIASTRQFHHVTYRYQLHNYKFQLPEEFKFCHNIDRYMIFVNGAKIDRDFYTVSIPKPTRPFDHVTVWISTFMLDEDVIDIFYVPDDLIEVIKHDQLDKSGDIIVELPEKCYPLSKELYMFFVNGIKVNPDWMIDLAINKVHIKTDIKNIHSLTIIRYSHIYFDYMHIREANPSIEDSTIAILDEYSSVIKDMGTNVSEIYNDVITNITPGRDYRLDYYTLRNLVYEIVCEYYMCRAGIDYSSEFVYDFEFVFDDDGQGGQSIPFFSGYHNDKMVMHRINTLADWQYAAISAIKNWSMTQLNYEIGDGDIIVDLDGESEYTEFEIAMDADDDTIYIDGVSMDDVLSWEIATYGYGRAGYINVFVDENDNVWYEVSADSDIKNIYVDNNGYLIIEYIKK